MNEEAVLRLIAGNVAGISACPSVGHQEIQRRLVLPLEHSGRSNMLTVTDGYRRAGRRLRVWRSVRSMVGSHYVTHCKIQCHMQREVFVNRTHFAIEKVSLNIEKVMAI
jgi:hypothetical protein